jgi:hypothetical protein
MLGSSPPRGEPQVIILTPPHPHRTPRLGLPFSNPVNGRFYLGTPSAISGGIYICHSTQTESPKRCVAWARASFGILRSNERSLPSSDSKRMFWPGIESSEVPNRRANWKTRRSKPFRLDTLDAIPNLGHRWYQRYRYKSICIKIQRQAWKPRTSLPINRIPSLQHSHPPTLQCATIRRWSRCPTTRLVEESRACRRHAWRIPTAPHPRALRERRDPPTWGRLAVS